MPKKDVELIPIRLNRKSPAPSLQPFTDYFRGFERVEAVRSVFGERTEQVLKDLRIGFIPNRGMYMGIRDQDGNIAVGTYHLKNSSTRTLYLDIVHELFHINQRMTDGKWFHDEFMKFMQNRSLYYASPIEIPAYRHTVREAERIGMSREEILSYLKFGNPPEKTWNAFVKEMNIRENTTGESITRFPVRIRRDAEVKLYPFSDYFLGFEKVGSVKELFGGATDETLRNLKVEFIDSPFPMIYPNEDDGHMVVASGFFRSGRTASVYLDVFLSLNLLKNVSNVSLMDSQSRFEENPGVLQSYEAMVKEGWRLRMGDDEITEHLQLPRFMMTDKAYGKFLGKLGLKATMRT